MNRLKKLLSLSLLSTVVISTAAIAKDEQAVKEFNPWQVRLRAIDVIPDANSTLVGIAGQADGNSQVVPEFDISYFIDKNISAELILATTQHDMKVKDGTNTTQLGSVWLLPPTLTVQYHFNTDGMVQPYVGAGVNYTWFYNVDKGPGLNRVTYKDGFGTVLQAGVDIMKDEHWGWNFDVKKVFLNTDASVNNGAITGSVDLDPWIIGTGITYKF